MSNLVHLVGDVLAVQGDEARLETVAELNSGTFAQVHTVVLNGAKVQAGNRYSVFGRLDIFDKLTKISADPQSWKKVPKKTPSENMVEIAGRLAGEMNYFPPDPVAQKVAMAGFLVAVKDAKAGIEKLFKGVVFKAMATAWDRVATPNAEIVLRGRIRHREYDPSKPPMLEIIGMKAGSSIKPGNIENPFGDYVPSDF